ncbi:MAG: hypothetical protein WED10_01940 [Brumimicrobium sp.]
MNKLLNFKIIALLFILIHFVSLAQKPKKTHDHEKFVKKVVFAMGADITKWSPDEDAIKYISENDGKSIDELRKLTEKNKKQLKEDVDFLNNNNIYRNYQNITLKNVSKQPVVADIILHCEMDDKPYDIVLRNCVQTNVSWYLGDRIIATGEWVESLNKPDESKKDEKKGLLAKLEEKNEAHENKNAPINAYVGEKFPVKGTDAHTQFFKMDLTGQFLNGYIVDEQGVKKEMKIRYDAPEILHNPNKKLITEVNGSKSEWTKKSIKAFYVGGQLFVFTGEFWDILLEEGTIRKLGRVVKDDEGNYITADLIQKQGMSPENTISLSLGFKNKMSEYVEENEALATKIKNKENGYKLRDIDEIIAVYNKWYDENYPDEVDYLFKPKTEVSENTLEKLGKAIFKALQSENHENFKPYVFTMDEVEHSNIKPDMIELLKNQANTDPKKSKAEWYGNKGRVSSFIKDYQKTDTETFKWSGIEIVKSERESNEVGIEIFDVKVHVDVNGKSGFFKFSSAQFGESWKVLQMPHCLFNINPSDETEVEEFPENYESQGEESEELEGDYEHVNESNVSIDNAGFIGTWTFSSYYEKGVDKTSEYEMGFLEGNPIKISIMEDFNFLYQNGVTKKYKINTVRWDYIETPDESNYVSPILITHYYSNGEEKAEIYDLTEVTDKRLVMENKEAQTKIIYQK